MTGIFLVHLDMEEVMLGRNVFPPLPEVTQKLSRLRIEAPRSKTSASSVESLRGMRSLLRFKGSPA